MSWKQKLSSRKLWMAVIGFVAPLLIAFNVSEIAAEQIVAMLSAAAVLITYIIGECVIDCKKVKYGEASNDEEVCAETFQELLDGRGVGDDE